jgi:FHA domain
MISCPDCQAENAADALACVHCGADFAAAEHEEVPTQRTRPRLLVLRQAAKAAELPAASLTDHGSGGPRTDLQSLPNAPAVRLQVVRGLRINLEYPLYEGDNVIGRGDDRPVDVDLRDQEPRDRVWASRYHAVVIVAGEALTVEDLDSTNGTYVNRHRLQPGLKRPLKTDDILQIGTTQLKVSR